MSDKVEVTVRLPLREKHVPVDGMMPDAVGVPVIAGQPTHDAVRGEGAGLPTPLPRVGRVTGWERTGDGHVIATLEIDTPEILDSGGILDSGAVFGLNAICKTDGDRVLSIKRVTSISLLPPSEA
jgi:hypothetical protein